MPPFAFLTIATFLASKSIRLMLSTCLLAAVALERSCASETQQPIEFPESSDFLQIPSVEDILVTGVPSLVFLVLFLRGIARVLARSRPGSHDALLNASLYIVGFQYALIAVVALQLLPENFFLAYYFASVKSDPGNIESLIFLGSRRCAPFDRCLACGSGCTAAVRDTDPNWLAYI